MSNPEEIEPKGRENKKLENYLKVSASPWTGLKEEEYAQ